MTPGTMMAIPGPPPMFLLGWRGNALQISRDPLGHVTRLRQQYGDIAALVQPPAGTTFPWMLPTPGPFEAAPRCPGIVFAFGPAYNKQILSNPALFQEYFVTGLEGTALRGLGSAILNMNGEKHKHLRRVMLPAFQKSRLETYYGDVVSLTRGTLDGWSVDQQRDIWRDLHDLALRIVGRVFLGLDIAPDVPRLGPLTRSWLPLCFSSVVMALPFDLPFTPYRHFLRLSRELAWRVRSLIARKRAAANGQGDVLALLVRAHEEDPARLTEDELLGQTNFLLLAGSLSSASALAWTLLLVAQHPPVMADLLDELDGRLGGEAPTLRQLDALPFLECVLRESLRLLPPVPLAARIAAESTRLGPYDLPRWSAVGISAYHTHRMPELYPRPHHFLPERWVSLDPSPYDYFPFGAGPRTCLGEAFALMEMKIVLAMLLQRFRLEVVPGARIDRSVALVMSPRHGLPMVVRRQDRQVGQSKHEVSGNVREMLAWV